MGRGGTWRPAWLSRCCLCTPLASLLPAAPSCPASLASTLLTSSPGHLASNMLCSHLAYLFTHRCLCLALKVGFTTGQSYGLLDSLLCPCLDPVAWGPS